MYTFTHICRSRSSHPHICWSTRSRSSHLTPEDLDLQTHNCRSTSSHLHICTSCLALFSTLLRRSVTKCNPFPRNLRYDGKSLISWIRLKLQLIFVRDQNYHPKQIETDLMHLSALGLYLRPYAPFPPCVCAESSTPFSLLYCSFSPADSGRVVKWFWPFHSLGSKVGTCWSSDLILGIPLFEFL